jgi:DNA-binding Xre family transcriptional regulator
VGSRRPVWLVAGAVGFVLLALGLVPVTTLTLVWGVHRAVIDRARVLRGWTRRDLAEQAHVDEGTLCDLFAGRRRPTFGTLSAICQALELSMDDVITFV